MIDEQSGIDPDVARVLKWATENYGNRAIDEVQKRMTVRARKGMDNSVAEKVLAHLRAQSAPQSAGLARVTNQIMSDPTLSPQDREALMRETTTGGAQMNATPAARGAPRNKGEWLDRIFGMSTAE